MKVKPKYFTYEDLPDYIKAAYGMYMDPGPKFPMPNMGAAVRDWDNNSPGLHPLTQMVNTLPTGINMNVDTANVKPGKGLTKKDLQPPKPQEHKKGSGFNSGNAMLLGLGAFDAMLPNAYQRHEVVQPQMGYNPYPYGTGSQALMDNGGSVGAPGRRKYKGFPALNFQPVNQPSVPAVPAGYPEESLFYPTSDKRGRYIGIGADIPGTNAYTDVGLIRYAGDEGRTQYMPSVRGAYATGAGDFGFKWNPENISATYSKRFENGGYIPGEDENNSPSAKNGKTMKAKKGKKSTPIYDEGGLAPYLFQGMGDMFGAFGDAASALMPIPGNMNQMLPMMPTGKDGNWIQKAVNPAHKGYCTPMTKSTCTPKRKALAKTFKKHHGFHKKDDGGIIPDNMSVFSPYEYEDGGNVNGGARIREVDARYPNSDLMEQWLLYANGGDLRPSIVKDSENRAMVGKNRVMYHNTARDRDATEFTQPMDMIELANNYNANIPEPGYSPMNFDPRTGYSATFPEGNQQKTSYFPNQESWQGFVNSNSQLVSDSQISQGGKRGSATLKNRPMKSGGTTRGGSDTTSLLEQWIPWMTGEYANGGTLSANKAKEMLRDGTANGKKLTPKQKKYFGMVAAGKAAMGSDMAYTGDPEKPKKSTDPIITPSGAQASQHQFGYGRSQIDRDALLADRVTEIIGNAYDPFTNKGRAVMDQIRTGWNDNQFASDLGVRIKSLQSDPTFQRLTPEQRISKFYETGATGTTGLDDFIRRSKSIGGNPGAYWQGNFTNPRRLANGGVMYDDGGEINTMWGGNAEMESYNPYDGGTVAFNGASHDNGGIGMQYNGAPIEVEGGEYASKDDKGNLHIYGNMNVPGTKTKFKTVAKAMADKEKRYDYLKARGSELVNNSNPADKFEQLSFNSGRAMMNGGNLGQADIAAKKDKLSTLQKAMLDTARQFGMDPQAMSKGKVKKARGGASIPFFDDGGDPGNDPTRADRNNNPGNIKYGKFAKQYGAKKDKDGFAIFPDRLAGNRAMRDLLKSPGYKNLSISDAIDKWTGHKPYNYNLDDIAHKSVGNLSNEEFNRLTSTMTKGEGTRYGTTPKPGPGPVPNTPVPNVPVPRTFTPYDIPEMGLTPEPKPKIPGTVEPPPLDTLKVPPDVKRPSNVEPLHLNQLMGEIYAAATNKVEPVPAQRYEPQLYEPYQMSMQDQLNRNEQSFNAAVRGIGPTNPSALGALAAQKYAADSQVKAEEFRTNQGIANDITNKNIALVNDAQMKNLALADTQMVRQSEAKSKTRQLNQMTINSLSSKYAQNEFENKRLAAYENLYDYRFMPTEDGGLKATYYGPNAMFNFDPKAAAQRSDVRTASRYDKYGNLKGYTEYDDYDTREKARMYDLMIKQQKVPLMKVPKLD